MKILSIDTSSRVCSVAILEDDKLIKENHNVSEKEHSQTLMPMIKQTLESINLTLDDIELLACGVGPGSFTGIRIGIATVKAFSDAKKIPIIGVDSLEAQATDVFIQKRKENCKIVSIIDAKKENAYFAVYRVRDGNLSIYKNADVNEIFDIINYMNFEEPVYLIGNIEMQKLEPLMLATISKEQAQGKDTCGFEYVKNSVSMAEAVGVAAFNKYKIGKDGDSNTIMPMYLRKPQAERQREGIQDEDKYIFELTKSDIEEIKKNYSKFPNLWDFRKFEEDAKNAKYYIEKQNNEIIGFIGFKVILDEIEIMNIVTRQDKRNQGVASDLLSHIIRKEKAKKINLEVNERSKTAISLYNKFGFKKVGQRSKYYNGKDDAILMTLY